ncbi:MAG: hypothetical protein LYZ66_01645 [Nitrososphaerales archaeon]|nr:hypothetical protein [Nitrososphaerales archaeon]
MTLQSIAPILQGQLFFSGYISAGPIFAIPSALVLGGVLPLRQAVGGDSEIHPAA